jgi:CRISPR-associated endonuclease Csy4
MAQNKITCYQEITLLSSEEVNVNFLLCKVYSELHEILSEVKYKDNISIGISFPKYNMKEHQIGDKIRLFYYSCNQAEIVNLKKRLGKYLDYVHITKVRDIPETNSYINFSRVENKGNKEKLARRYATRHNLSYDEAVSKYNEYEMKRNSFPFIRLKSNSNENYYFLHIKMEESDFHEGQFNNFGLSKLATVPNF